MKALQQRWALMAVSVLIFIAALMVLGHSAGKAMAEKDIERVQLLWPDILAMPEHDRARIVHSAMACNLSRKPLQVEAVAECLRNGAEQMREDDALGAERVNNYLPKQGINHRKTAASLPYTHVFTLLKS